jgi:two-component sensor histidine kinase
MVDDSSADRKLYRILLTEEYGVSLDFREAPDARRGLALCDPLPDCLLLDYNLPDMTGVEFLRRLGQCTQRGTESVREIDVSRTDLPWAELQRFDLPRFAVVMLTGLGNEQVAAEAMRAGAHDYLMKDRITAESLRLAIEKATGKIALLKDLQAERDRLAELLAEKDALLEEVHHRVKNNLQVIASLLRLQAETFGDERLTAALGESQNRVESMALIHEQLYQARNLREVDLGIHAALVANRLMDVYGIDPAVVRCSLNVQELRVGVDRAIPAALILNELMSNALKHAFPGRRAGTIDVTGRREILDKAGLHDIVGDSGDGPASSIVIEVRDDGVGLAAGAGSEPSRTLGLHIVRILTRQLRGAFFIESAVESGAGTLCRLTIPGEGGKHASHQVLREVGPTVIPTVLQRPTG